MKKLELLGLSAGCGQPFICADENIPNKTGNLSKNDDAICHVLLYNKVIIGKIGSVDPMERKDF